MPDGSPIPLGIYAEDGSSPFVRTDEDEMDDWCRERAGIPRPAQKIDPADCAAPPRPLPAAPRAAPVMGTTTDVGESLNDLGRVGWAVLYGPNTSQAIKDSLSKLIAFRKAAIADPRLFQEFDAGNCPYQPGQSAADWLANIKTEANHNAGIEVNAMVRPKAGVPYYVMIVASPQDISFEFQCDLDTYWGVGRLWLGEETAAYAAYADAVIDSETNPQPCVRRELRFFSPRFEGDKATEMVTELLVKRLVQNLADDDTYGFKVNVTDGVKATRDEICRWYTQPQDRPAIFFPATHGVLCKATGKLLESTQGAILGQPWQEDQAPSEKCYMAGRHVDLPTTDLRGTFHMFLPCYGAGWPETSIYDDAVVSPKGPMVAHLPQVILAKGGLGMLGHVDRSWSYTYASGGGIDRTGEYENVLLRLMQGWRAGNATDQFNARWKSVGDQISDKQRKGASAAQLHDLWIEHDDARYYILHGDPAAKLNVDKMSSAA